MNDNSAVSTFLNTQSLVELQGLLGDDLFDITGLFAQQVRLDAAQLQAQAAQADWPALARTAHAVKGSAGNLGAQALSQWAANTEKAALAGNATAVAQALPALPGLVEQTLTTLRDGGFLRD
ncbi:Hpt domain-containing protein [Aquabacterium sp. A08]|uniref:Hpt domain-containing protein n=1 Tax=Aquabacterium sp. A08 TaxID=2718532 RepID=UPI001AAE2627